jgi:DNA-binding NarL/FixJ family response regulator
MSTPKWDDERVATLKQVVGTTSPVTAELVEKAAATLETTTRSVASKLRNMDIEVESMAKDTSKKYSAAEEAELERFLDQNAGKYTYAEIAEKVLKGSRTAKQIQGKILSMEKTDAVKPTPKKEVELKYTEAEETKLLGLLAKGGFIEDIADAMGREVNSIRGKILSLSRSNPDITIPKQRNKKAAAVDPIEALGDISGMSVAEIAEAIEKTERGVKTMLTHRGLNCSDYNGEKRKAKADAAVA